MASENKYEKLTFIRSSFSGIDSLMLEVWTEDREHHLATLLFYDETWQVMLTSLHEGIRLHWEDFGEMFRRFTIFMSDESMRLLNDKDATIQEIENALQKLENTLSAEDKE